MNGEISIILDPKTIATVVIALIACFGALLKVMLSLFIKHLDERAAQQDKQLAEMKQAHSDQLHEVEDRIETSLLSFQQLTEQRLRTFEDNSGRERDRLSRLEASHNALHDMLAMRFVQREDFIRFASSIDSKIERLGELFTRMTIQRGPHD